MKKGFAIVLLFLILALPAVQAGNTYVPIAAYQSDGTGHLYITARCMHNIFSNTVLMKRSGDDWNNSAVLTISPDGKYDGLFVSGTFELWLLDGNAGHGEFRDITIYPGETSYVQFIGHAVSYSATNISPVPTPTPTITPTPTTTPVPTPSPTQTPTISPTPTTTPVPTPTPDMCCYYRDVVTPDNNGWTVHNYGDCPESDGYVHWYYDECGPGEP